MGWFTSHAEDHAEKVQKAHNDGQTDASNGKYEKPYGLGAYVTNFDKDPNEMDEINKSYDNGQQNHKSQK